MSDRNRDRLIEGILYYKEAIKNSSDKEYIERCQKKIEEFSKEELIRYLDTIYMQRIETGFVEAVSLT